MPEATCALCGVTKSTNEFYSTGRRCKLCCRARTAARGRAQTLRHGGQPSLPRPAGSSTVDARFALTRLVRAAIGCADCYRTEPVGVLQFDHLPQYRKSFDISWGAKRTRYVSDRRLIEEMLKCDVVCASCHNLRTKWRKRQGIIVLAATDRHLYAGSA